MEGWHKITIRQFNDDNKNIVSIKLKLTGVIFLTRGPYSLLDSIIKLFEKILLARILHEVSERGLMRDDQFGF